MLLPDCGCSRSGGSQERSSVRRRMNVTDDTAALKKQLEAATGERISALEGIGEKPGPEAERDGRVPPRVAEQEPEAEPEPPARGMRLA